jgi:hypothetical protein
MSVKYLCAALLLISAAAQADPIPKVAGSSNMEIIGHSDLNGAGKGGEGLALRQYPDGRRVLFLAHESAPMCVSVIDVTKPEDPKVMTQIPAVAPLRCNSLGLSGTTMTVAHQSEKQGEKGVGMDVYDVADPAHPKKLAFFDTSGPHSRGVHYLWFADGRYAYLSTGSKDFVPHNKADDQFLMIVDLAEPAHPKEVGRWWLPGTRVGDKEAPPPRVHGFDSGIRMHTPSIAADRPDRLYVGWIDGGWVILDTTDKAHPKLVAHESWQSQDVGFAHTVLAIPSRNLAIQTEEAVTANCKDWPKRDWVWDISNEGHPVVLAPMPPPADFDALCKAGGRFGAHNIHQNRPDATAAHLSKTVVGSFFNGGVRAYSIENPNAPVEIGYLVDAAPPGNATHTIQINDVYVDELGLIYANDRLSGGLDIIRYTGSVPLQ